MANFIKSDGSIASFDVNGQPVNVAVDALSPDLKAQLGIPELNFTPGVPAQEPLQQIIGNPQAYGLAVPDVDELRMGTTPKRQMELLQLGQDRLTQQKNDLKRVDEEKAQAYLESAALKDTLNSLTGRAPAQPPAVSNLNSAQPQPTTAFDGLDVPESPLDFPRPPAPDVMTQGFRRQLSGIEAASKAEAAQKKAEAQGLLDYASQMERLNKEAESKEVERRKQEEESAKVFKASSDAAANFEYKDPFSSGEKIGAGIAVALGAMGSAIAGVPNYAMTIIQNTIDRNLDLQKKNYEKMKDKATADRTMYLDLRDKLKDERITDAAFKAASLEQTMARVKAMTAGFEDPIVKARGEQLAGNLMQEYGKAKANLEIALLDQQQKAAKSNAESREFYVPLLGADAVSKEGAKALRQLTGEVKSANAGIDELISMSSRSGKSLSPTDRAQAKTIQRTLVGQLRTALTGPGSMSEGDRELLESVIADPTSIFSLDSSNVTKLQTLKKALQSKVASAAQSEGINYAMPSTEQPVDAKRQRIDLAIKDAQRVLNDPNSAPALKYKAQQAIPALQKMLGE